MEFRKCEIKINDSWELTEFKNLKKDDLFRLFDYNEPVVNKNGNSEFIALTDAYLDHDIYTVDVED